MKYIRVTIEAIYQVPDDVEISVHSEDEIECITRGKDFFAPTSEWMKREADGTWMSGGEEFEQFGELESEAVIIDPITEEELNELFEGGEDEE